MNDSNELVLKQAARAALRFSEGGTYQSIGAELGGLSKKTVDRRLELAVEQGWLSRRPVFSLDTVPEKYRPVKGAQASDSDLDRIVKKWKTPVLFHSIDGNVADFHAEAASLIANLVRQSSRIGVAWGRTLNAVIGQLTLLEGLRRPTKPAHVIPLCPEPLSLLKGEKSNALSSTSLAQELQRLVGQEQMVDELPHLTGIPAYVPTSFASAFKSRSVRSFFTDLSPDYAQLFGSGHKTSAARSSQAKRPLVDQMDLLLTGGGRIDDQPGSQATGLFIRERLSFEADRVNLHQELLKASVGDIAGLLIPKPDISRKLGQLVERLNQGWLGITEQHLRDCVARNQNGKKGGVVLLAIGKKAELVREVVRLGLVSRVIIDVHCRNSICVKYG